MQQAARLTALRICLHTMPTWLARTYRAPSRYCRGETVYGQETPAMHRMRTPSPPYYPLVRHVTILIALNFAEALHLSRSQPLIKDLFRTLKVQPDE